MNNGGGRVLLQIISESLERLSGEYLVESALPLLPITREKWRVVAIGKAAASMACGAINAIGLDNISRQLVITKKGQAASWMTRLRHAEVLETAHPVPDQSSLQAGQRLLELTRQQGDEAILFLISGGASSLVEVLQPDIRLTDLQRVNHWLQASGLPVHMVNTVRSRLSLIKGGKLLRSLQDKAGFALLLSDVQGDDPGIIGSGLLCPGTVGTLPETLPDWLVRLLPVEDDFQPSSVFPNLVIANLQTALDAVADCARKTGLSVMVIDKELVGPAAVAGKEIAEYVSHAASPGIYIFGGETTVELPQSPGRGGRNQHLALAAAIQLAGREDIQLLAVGSDGDDGNSNDAGALVDGGTIERGSVAGLNASLCLRSADSGSFLEASGDLVTTGPTGTNLRDLVIALKR